ncbi:MAG: hypothetical protein PWQ06_2635 [Anaerophaga sp.]|nr:hypothetical protein [Anaerophaga sp.]
MEEIEPTSCMFLLPHQIDQIMDTAFTSEGVIRLNTEELPAVQYEGMRVSDLLKEKGDKMIYRYDFGDDWERFAKAIFCPVNHLIGCIYCQS